MDSNVSASDEPSAPDDGNDPFVNEEPTPGVVIPDHRLLRCIGRGSYGSVWLAQNMMGMYRAVKIVHRQSFEHHRPFERELSGILKFEPISRSHEGFVDVLHVGIRDKDFLYYVMELGDDEVTGQNIVPKSYSPKTLSREISSSGRLTFEQCLRLGLALSEALGELHKHGLVHRDIKPSNILYLNGIPKLADIGLVASTSEARSYVGTEGFIPPEGPGTPAGDVYSLGKVLYEASTGKDRHEFPELPTLLHEIPEREKFLELNEIMLRACHSDPRQRYQSAAEMHSDLVVLSNGESVKRLRFLEKRFASLKKVASVGVLVLAMISVVLFLVYNAYVRSRRQQVDAYTALGNRSVESGDYLGALPYFAEAVRMETSEGKRENARIRFAAALSQSPKLVQLWSSSYPMETVAFDASGQRLLTSEDGGCAQVFDVKTGKPVSPRIGERETVLVAAISPDGNRIATGNSTNIYIWSIDGTKIRNFAPPCPVGRISFSPDGKKLAAAGDDDSTRIWDAETGELRMKLTDFENNGSNIGLMSAVFSHDGKMIATAGRNGTAKFWDVGSGRQLGPTLQHSSWVDVASFSPDDRLLATGCWDHKLHIWEVSSGKEILPAMAHDDGIVGVQFSPDGQYIVTAGVEGTARIWNLSDHQPFEVNPILKHGDRVRGAVIAPNGHQIATACRDGNVRLWELAGGGASSVPDRWSISEDGQRYLSRGPELGVFDLVTGKSVSPQLNFGFPVREAWLSFDGTLIIAAGAPRSQTNAANQKVAIFETSSGRQRGVSLSIPDSVKLELSRDAKRLLVVYTNSVQTWDVETGARLSPEITGHGSVSASLSPDGSRIALWSGQFAELRDAVTGKELFPALKLETIVKGMKFNFDGSRFLTYCSDSTWNKCSARIWNSATGRQIGAPLQHNDGVVCAAFSPDGRRVATGGEDYRAVVWNAETGERLTPPLKHAHQVWGVAFSPNSRWVATASRDQTARIWSAETGEPLTPPFRHAEGVEEVRFLPDGRNFLTTTFSGETWLWKVPREDHPDVDLQELATVLSSGAVGLSWTPQTVEPQSLRARWLELRDLRPEQFSTTPNQIATWDEYQARKSEATLNWPSAVFHLERLLALNPGDVSLANRLQRAREKSEATAVTNGKQVWRNTTGK